MSKFLDTINEKLSILNEEEPPAPPVDPAAAPAGDPAAPAETPDTALPDEDTGQDDTAKLKVDYVEMIRKALIMAPKHIDDVDYAKLTKIVDTENLEEMQELVSRIVRNNYPHPDL
jgi:predicted lipid-binding transport protein (Tim44 family)